MQITIPGKPIPKKRPRFARVGKFTKAYSAQKKEEKATRLVIASQWYGKPLEGAVRLDVVFFMPIPKSTSKKQKAAMLLGNISHTKKPDIDNLLKFLLDCMNGIVFEDDSQVINVKASKIYNGESGTCVVVQGGKL
jgi:Holliday junction resolvase RusA-like endonuclease